MSKTKALCAAIATTVILSTTAPAVNQLLRRDTAVNDYKQNEDRLRMGVVYVVTALGIIGFGIHEYYELSMRRKQKDKKTVR